MRLQLLDYKCRERFFKLCFPMKFRCIPTVFALHPAVRLFKIKIVIDCAADRAFHIVRIHNSVFTSNDIDLSL